MQTFKHSELLHSSSTLGKFTGPPVHLDISSSQPPISFTDWATSVAVVTKRVGLIRMCNDYKATINTVP